jgi:ABC-type phosphate/phosphonate transport system substrate-binding protein
VIEALLNDTIDVGPLDSYAWDLIVEHKRELRSRIRIVATTDPAPIPFLVASAGCADDIVERLRAAFLAFTAAETADLRRRLCLEGFAPVDLTEYELIPRWENGAKKAGYHHPS